MSVQSNTPTSTSTEAEVFAATQLAGIDIMSIAEASGASVVDSTDVNTGLIVRRKSGIKNASLSDLAHIVQPTSKNSLASADALGFTSVISKRAEELTKLVLPEQPSEATAAMTDEQKVMILSSLQEIAAIAEKQASSPELKEEVTVTENSDIPAKKTRKPKPNVVPPSPQA